MWLTTAVELILNLLASHTTTAVTTLLQNSASLNLPYWTPGVSISFRLLNRIAISDEGIVHLANASKAATQQIEALARLRISFNRLLQTMNCHTLTLTFLSEWLHTMVHPPCSTTISILKRIRQALTSSAQCIMSSKIWHSWCRWNGYNYKVQDAKHWKTYVTQWWLWRIASSWLYVE